MLRTVASPSPAQDPSGGDATQNAVPSGGSSRMHPLAAAMSEAALEEHIRDACKKLGIVRFHVRVSLGTTAGLPDDILIGPCGILWRECKRQNGKPTPAQVKTGKALTATGQDYAIWKPEDWLSGQITTELMAIAGIGRRMPPGGGDAA